MSNVSDNAISERRIQAIEERLQQSLTPLKLQVDDESAAHYGHAGAASGAGHFRVTVLSSQFSGLSKVTRHRMVYDSLADLMGSEIHALALVTIAPGESSPAVSSGR